MNTKSGNKKGNTKKGKKRTAAQSDRLAKKKWYQKTGWILLLLLMFFPLGLFLMIRYTKWKKPVKTILGVFSGFWFLSLVYAMTLPTPEQISLSADTSKIYDVNTEVAITLKTTPEDCSIPESAFTVSDGKLSFKDDKITFTSSAEGEFEIYAKYSDITSNKITLKFEDIEKKLAEEAERTAAEQAEAERIAAEQAEAERIAAEQAEAARIAQEQAEAERVAAEQAEATRIAQEQAEAARIAQEQAEAARIAQEQAAQQQNVGQMVWISATGSKYHSIPNCGRMNPAKAYQMSVSDAHARGYDACSKCY